MRRGEDIRAIRKVQEVRLVQRMAAEMALSRANAALADAEAQQRERAERLEQDHAAWAQSLSGRPFSLEVVKAWSAEVLTSQTGLRQADARRAEASGEKDLGIGALRAAQMREEAAGEVARGLFSRARRAREETMLSELADRTARRGAGR